jgi:hypothetical protein
MPMVAAATILPDPEQLQLLHLAATATAITAVVATTGGSTRCPLCGWPASRRHSRYVRSVADVPPLGLRSQARRDLVRSTTLFHW